MVVYSILTLFGLGLVAALILAVASRVFYVEEDPRVEAVMDVLPGANCGGCGYAGCEGYAVAVVNDPNISAGLCCAGGADVSAAVGELTGKAVGAAEPLCSFRRCDKVSGHVKQRHDYQGLPTCAASALMSEGADSCKYSCLGYGDCVQACSFDAMKIEQGLVQINPTLCIGCGQCISVCPHEVLELIPQRARVAVVCSTQEKLKAVTEVCGVGCIKCGRCIKACPAKAVSLKDARLHIDQTACLAYGAECEEKCAEVCPRKILQVICPTAQQAKCTADGTAEKGVAA